jgi:hypothetical protein
MWFADIVPVTVRFVRSTLWRVTLTGQWSGGRMVRVVEDVEDVEVDVDVEECCCCWRDWDCVEEE